MQTYFTEVIPAFNDLSSFHERNVENRRINIINV